MLSKNKLHLLIWILGTASSVVAVNEIVRPSGNGFDFRPRTVVETSTPDTQVVNRSRKTNRSPIKHSAPLVDDTSQQNTPLHPTPSQRPRGGYGPPVVLTRCCRDNAKPQFGIGRKGVEQPSFENDLRGAAAPMTSHMRTQET